MLTRLALVYPPVTNREADWLSSVPEVQEQVRESQFYVIAHRPDTTFQSISFSSDAAEVHFDLVCGAHRAAGLRLHLPSVVNAASDRMKIELGERLFRVWGWSRDEPEDAAEVLYWATPNSLLFHVWRGRYEVAGLQDVRPFTRFDVLYVGISPDSDALSRLFVQGHKKRVKILSQERQKVREAALTDELCLFLFRHETLRIDSALFEDADFEKVAALAVAGEEALLRHRVLADVEKAFIKLMDPKYNDVKYAGFPRSRDGLWGQEVHRYGYSLDETIAFRTDSVEIVGSHGGWMAGYDEPGDNGDLLFVAGEDVQLLKFRPGPSPDAAAEGPKI